MKASTITARYTRPSISTLAFFTTMLVAASMPALPAALRMRSSSLPWRAAKPSTTFTTLSRVSALWSLR